MKNATNVQQKFETLTKLEIAERQLNEAIVLFFEGRDSVSVHTLVGASIQVSLDHLSEDDVIDNNIFLDGRSIYIKDEYRKQFIDHINKAKNFFKHADRDLQRGQTTIDFNPEINEGYIFEAVRALAAANKRKAFSQEVAVFMRWFTGKNPHYIKDEFRQEYSSMSPLSLPEALSVLKLLKRAV